MSLATLDYISPKITFYYKGYHSHNSKFGGLLTIIMIILVIVIVIYYFFTVVLYRNLTSIFYRKYENDVGYYPLKPSYLSHYIYIYENRSNFHSKLDSRFIRIILIENHELYDSNPNILESTEHWLYDQYEIENTSQNFQNMQNAIYIKYYYNPLNKRYYSLNDTNNFKYPYLEHGSSNPNNTHYGTVIETCNNNSITKEIFGECKSEKEINKYIITHNKIHIKILDNQIDLSNFKNPIQPLFYELTSNIVNDKDDYYICNINYNPLSFKTHQNYFTGKMNEVNTFSVDKSNIYYSQSKKKSSKNIILKYTFSIQNLIDIYERKYDNFMDILPRVGGLIEIIYHVFYYFNILYNRYILASDTQELYLGKDGLVFFQKQNKIFKKRKRLISKQRLFNQCRSQNSKISVENQNQFTCNNGFASPLKLNILKNRMNENDIPKRKSDSKDFDDFSNLPLFALKNSKKMFNHTNNKNYVEDNDIGGKNDISNIKLKNNTIDQNINNIKTVSFVKKKRNKKFLNSLNSSVVKKIKTSVDNKNNYKAARSLQNGISFCDIFTSGNYPMLEYFNLNKKGKVMDQNFFSKKIRLIDYLYYLFSLKRHYCNIKILEKFHKKLMSEEYLYHSHILLYVIYKKVFMINE